MKVIPLSEAKANLNRYGRLCQDGAVIVTVNGVRLSIGPLEEGDFLVDRLIAQVPNVRHTLEVRAAEPVVS
jgi:hypothetical protein